MNIFKKINDYYISRKTEQAVRTVQEHNLSQFLESICNPKCIIYYSHIVLQEEYNICIKSIPKQNNPYNTSKSAMEICQKKLVDLQVCQVTQRQVIVMFRNRQDSFIKDIDKK